MIGAIHYVRTPDGVGYIFGKNGNDYQIALVERDQEVTYPASKLTIWEPMDGEAVTTDEDWPHDIVPVWSKD